MKGRGACVVGVGESDCGMLPDKTALQLHQQAAKAALEDAGLGKEDVDGVFSCGDDWTHALLLAEYLGLSPSYVDSTQVGGASWQFFVAHATAALQAGLCTVALVVSGSTVRSDLQRRRRAGEVHSAARGPAQFEAPYGLTLVGKYALAARRHMHEYGTTSRQLAAVAVAANRWAQLNPKALHHGQSLSIDDALKTRMIADPLREADCCVRTDGGAAVVLTTEERARDLNKASVRVLGCGASLSHLHMSQWHEMPEVATALGRRALEQAGIAARDIDVLQIDDAFTIMVLLSLEALGLCGRGESGHLAESGALAPGGTLPTNTDGGGLASNHPGMRGLFLLIEATRQLRGECGARQVPHARVALCNGIGGSFSSCGTVLLGV